MEENNSLCRECEQRIKDAYCFKLYLASMIPSCYEIIKQRTTERSSDIKTLCHLCMSPVKKLSVNSAMKFYEKHDIKGLFHIHMEEVVSSLKYLLFKYS